MLPRREDHAAASARLRRRRKGTARLVTPRRENHAAASIAGSAWSRQCSRGPLPRYTIVST